MDRGVARSSRSRGHIDEIGFQITHIDAEGLPLDREIGSWDASVVVGPADHLPRAGGNVVGWWAGRRRT
jgi:putative aminopeptidase FrvX